jgi:hypothetical protein
MRAQASTKASKTGKSNRKNRYVIKVMNSNREGGQVLLSFVRENQRLFEAF